jgi:prepilin-type N-terminal cleavage/methylation domain-containing protein
VFSSSPRRSSRQPRLYDTGAPTGLRARTAADAGFSMPEILAVLVIVAILTAIAIGVFSSQPAKAMSAHAKELARTAATAAQTLAADDSGSFDKVTPAELNRAEPTLRITASGGEPYVSAARGEGSEYEIVIKAPNGDEFKIGQKPTGETSHTCVNPSSKAPCAGAESGSW